MTSRPNPFAAAVMAPDGMASSAPRTVASPASASSIPWLGRAIHAAAPNANVAEWVNSLEPHLVASGITTPHQVAALLGQAAVEAGTDFNELAENTCYTHPERLCKVFPSRFPSMAIAQQYVRDDERIACRAYAFKNGNGGEDSGDGWRFRGSGLLQLTGRANFQAFASSLQATADQVTDWVREPDGAAASACWFWRTNKLKDAAEAWHLDEVTRVVTGCTPSARNRHPDRVRSAEAALNATAAD
jgi:putative chitinase